jgi:hypothetical protein
MRKLTLVTLAVLFASGAAAPAIAQNAVVELTPDQQTTIVQDFSADEIAPAPSVSFDVATGVVVPDTVELHPLPANVIAVVPDYSGYQYFRTSEGQIVIVSPDSKKIVTVLK